MGRPEDIAEAIAILAWDAAGLNAGKMLGINRGMWCD